MVLQYKYLDVCEVCESRELDFIFFDLKAFTGKTYIIRDIPGFRCPECGEILLSNGVIEVLDEIKPTEFDIIEFPVSKYQEKILKLSKQNRDIAERYLHSWNLIKEDGREFLEKIGLRCLGEWQKIVNA